MKANRACEFGCALTVFLDGKKLDDCIEADDGEGVAWVAARGRDGRHVRPWDAKPGDFLADGLLLKRLTGKVEFKIDHFGPEIEEEIRRAVDASYYPVRIIQVVQG